MRGSLAVAVLWILAVVPAASAAAWRALPMPKMSVVRTFTASGTVPGLAWTFGDEQLEVTHDGGLTWTPTGMRDVPVHDALPSRWWRANGGLERSDDDGATWQAVPGLEQALDPGEPGIYSGLSVAQLLADPVRSGVLYAIVNSGVMNDYAQTVFASPDGGITWSHWPYLANHYSRGDRGFVATWSALPGRDALLLVRAGALESDVEQEVSVVSAAGSTVLQYGTGTRGPGDEGSGTIVGLTLTGRAALDASGTRVLLESKRGWQLSTDTGASFQLLQPPVPAQRVAPVFDPSHPGRIYALRNGRLFRSDDEGRGWQGLATGLANVQGLSVDAGGLVYAYGPTGLASSQDSGETFADLGFRPFPPEINALRDDGHGGLLAATSGGLWRIGADEQWRAIDHGLFKLPATGAAPVGGTRSFLVVRPAVEGGERSVAPGPSLELLPEHGTSRVLPLPPRFALWWGVPVRAIASDANARRIVLGTDWTATGGRTWHLGPLLGATTRPLSPSRVIYGVRHLGAGRSSLWSRSGQRPWTRVARVADDCDTIAGERRHLFVSCGPRLLSSDDGGGTLRKIFTLPGSASLRAMAADPRRPQRVALLVSDSHGCTLQLKLVTLTSTDAGRSWLRTAGACGIDGYDHLAFAPNGDLLRWSGDETLGLQLLDDWH